MVHVVKCCGQKHRVEVDAEGTIHLLDHDDGWLRIERVAHALGGPLCGCFAVWHGWTSDLPGAWRTLPKTLRELARDRERRREEERRGA